MTFPVFLKLLRLFQVVGKIDDTLALLNLVSFSFGFCLCSAPRWVPPGCAGWDVPTPRAPHAALSTPPSLPPALPGLHDEHHLPAVHSESQGFPPPLPPAGPACPPAQEGSDPKALPSQKLSDHWEARGLDHGVAERREVSWGRADPGFPGWTERGGFQGPRRGCQGRRPAWPPGAQ